MQEDGWLNGDRRRRLGWEGGGGGVRKRGLNGEGGRKIAGLPFINGEVPKGNA